MRHVWAILISILMFLLLYTIWSFYDESTKTHLIKIAASGKGDTYKTAQAIAKVTHKHFEDITIKVVSTLGSTQSQNLLNEGLVDLALLQADTKVTSQSMLVSLLFPDAFQLIVRRDSKIKNIYDLKNKQIALAHKTSGQYRSFWALAKHYGLKEGDLVAKSMSDSAAFFALEHNSIDAIFRVRPIGNEKIKNLIKSSKARLIPIKQADALHLDKPALVSGIIPKGAYQGHPAIPSDNLSTIIVYRILVASKTLDEEIVKDITSILFEQKQELQSYIKLAGLAKQPDSESGTTMPIHLGAQSYYDKDEPNFIEKYLNKFGFLLTIGAFLGSILLKLRAYRQKIRADRYASRLMKIIKKSQGHQTQEVLQKFANELNDMLREIQKDQIRYKINHDGFEMVSFYWEMARDEVNEELLGGSYEK